MKINKATKANFHMLETAAKAGDTCIMDARDKATGKSVVLVCAAQHEADNSISMVPFAVMINGNPYEMYDPPNPNGKGYCNG